MTLQTSAAWTATVTAASSGGTPAWLAGKALLTWFQIPGTARSSAGGVDGELNYSGCCVKASSSELWQWGGGHGDTNVLQARNAPYMLRLAVDAPAWSQRRPPTAAVTQNVERYSDGRPSARHTYQDIQYIESRDRMFAFGSSSTYGDGNTSGSIVEAFNPATNDWDHIAALDYLPVPVPSTNVGVGCALDAAGNVWRTYNSSASSASGAVLRWNAANATWTSFPAQGTPQDYNSFSAYDPIRNRIVLFCGAGGGYIDVATGAKTNATIGSGSGKPSPVWVNETINGLAGSFLTMPTNTGVVTQVNPTTFAASTLAIAGTAPGDCYSYSGMRASRFQYIPALKVCVVVGNSSENLFVFRTG